MSSGKSLIWIFTLLITSLVQAGVYKWVDEQGRVHYGDRPASDNAGEVRIRDQGGSEPSADSVSRHEKQQRFLRAREEDREEKKQARAKNKRKKLEAKRNCEQAKKEYDKYRHAGAIYDKGKGGERKYLSFKAREEYEKSLAAEVKKWCK
jgi:hypothetical protein